MATLAASDESWLSSLASDIKDNESDLDDHKQQEGVPPSDKIVKLNVGGQLFTTYESTLLKSPFFQAIFSGKFGDKQSDDGSYFIDRDGEYFKYLLNFLRCGYVEISTASASLLHREALYFQIPLDLTHIIKKMQRPNIILSQDTRKSAVWTIQEGEWTKVNMEKIPGGWDIGPTVAGECEMLDLLVERLVNRGGYRIVTSSASAVVTKASVCNDYTTGNTTGTAYQHQDSKWFCLEPYLPEKVIVGVKK